MTKRLIKIGLILIPALALLGWLAVKVFAEGEEANKAQTNGNPLFPPEMNAAEFSKTDRVGDLGGVKVKIPHHFADFLEYEGDPSWGEKRKGAIPKRDFNSKITSFGFDVRYPDMMGVSDQEMWRDKRKYDDFYWEHYYDPTKNVTPWKSVGVRAMPNNVGEDFLTWATQSTLAFNHTTRGFAYSGADTYTQLPDKKYGLTVYVSKEINPKTGKLYRDTGDSEDLYIARDVQGQVSAIIRCSTGRRVPKATRCEHMFSMMPKMHLKIEVRYKHKDLPNWRDIQQKVSALILNFAVTDASTGSTPSKP